VRVSAAYRDQINPEMQAHHHAAWEHYEHCAAVGCRQLRDGRVTISVLFGECFSLVGFPAQPAKSPPI
jgi:hypothetical protein